MSQRKIKKGKEAESAESHDHTATTVEGELIILSTTDEPTICLCQDTDWVVDTGASYHATPHREFFTTYRTGDFGVVRMGNTGTSVIAGIGDIHLQTNLGCRLILKDVRHVPDLRLNLLSVGKLDDEGSTSVFSKGQWKLTSGSLVQARGKKCCTLYKMQGKICNEELNAAEESSIQLWHRRLGHMSQKGLQTLANGELIPDLKGTQLDPCVHCLAGKQHRVSFIRNTIHRKSHVLERVYTDVCGPIRTTVDSGFADVKTFNGALYFVTFIDDFSRKVWAYPLKRKDKVLDVFKIYHPMVERETGKQIKCIRSDNGGEYTGPFHEYCKTYGIRHELTVPGTPQHNAIAERMNHTIMERIRCMLAESTLPKQFWGEAMKTAVDVINMSPSHPLGNDVAERVWSGKNISYQHLRVFGCRAFAHVPKNERSKLDEKTRQCIFWGYGDDTFGYRLWDPEKQKTFRSRDVVFFEDQTLEDIKKKTLVPTSTKTSIEMDSDTPPVEHDEGGEIQGDQTEAQSEPEGGDEDDDEHHSTRTSVEEIFQGATSFKKVFST